jgi:hypothetical protein
MEEGGRGWWISGLVDFGNHPLTPSLTKEGERIDFGGWWI